MGVLWMDKITKVNNFLNELWFQIIIKFSHLIMVLMV